MAYVEFEKVKKTYHMGEVSIEALKDATFEIEKGEICVIVGASGAGKTTLLNILGGMDSLTSGRIVLDGKEISSYNANELTTYRRYDVGFVFQFYNLVQNLTAIENVELAAQICKNPMDAAEVIDLVGLHDRAQNFPAQLSGGEQQRVAIARALAKIRSSCSATSRQERLTITRARQCSSFCRIAAGKRHDSGYHNPQSGAHCNGGQSSFGKERCCHRRQPKRAPDTHRRHRVVKQ